MCKRISFSHLRLFVTDECLMTRVVRLSYRFHARVINNRNCVYASTSCGSHPMTISLIQQDRILPVQLFCTSMRTETKQNTCVSLSYMPMYLYNNLFKTASESENSACDGVVLHG